VGSLLRPIHGDEKEEVRVVPSPPVQLLDGRTGQAEWSNWEILGLGLSVIALVIISY